jgi:hypothetical protein
MTRELWQRTVLVARGFFLATILYCSLYAWWMYGSQPTGASGAMYAWIRHFYGSVGGAFVGVVGFFATFVKLGRRQSTAA